jgi:UDP-N-acetylglucosamine 2-epimerase (non-hydrolysing)
MPEEINRVLTDQISDILFITEKSARENLLREGISASRIHFVGNVMIDSLRYNLARSVPVTTMLRQHGASVGPGQRDYAVLTLHRASNVDDPATLTALLRTVVEVSQRIPVVFPVHPRTRSRIEQAGLGDMLKTESLVSLPPLDYLEMLGLLRTAKLILTDSGGIQEETTALGIPCITLRDNTERPITAEEGTNTIVGLDHARIMGAVDEVLRTGGKAGRIPALWDGRASQRIVAVLQDWLSGVARGRVV